MSDCECPMEDMQYELADSIAEIARFQDGYRAIRRLLDEHDRYAVTHFAYCSPSTTLELIRNIVG